MVRTVLTAVETDTYLGSSPAAASTRLGTVVGMGLSTLPAPYMERRPHLSTQRLAVAGGVRVEREHLPTLFIRSIFIICDAHTTPLCGSTNFQMRTPM